MATTSEQIVIRGDLVEIETRSVTRSMPLAELIPLIAVAPAITLPRLPRGARFVHYDPGTHRLSLLVEVAPKLQSLRTNRQPTSYRLAMPYQYYCFTAVAQDPNVDANWRLENWLLLWSQESVTSLDSPVIPALMPNIYRDTGVICFGSTQPDSRQIISSRIDQIVSEFEVTTFNGDLGWNRPAAYRGYSHWATESRRDPFVFRTWDEWNRARPLRDMLHGATQGAVRPTDVILDGSIPAVTAGWTFGRAAEWLRTLDPVQRYRLIEALAANPDMTRRVPDFDPMAFPLEDETAQPEPEPEPAPAAPEEPIPDDTGLHPADDWDDLHDEDDDDDEEPEPTLPVFTAPTVGELTTAAALAQDLHALTIPEVAPMNFDAVTQRVHPVQNNINFIERLRAYNEYMRLQRGLELSIAGFRDRETRGDFNLERSEFNRLQETLGFVGATTAQYNAFRGGALPPAEVTDLHTAVFLGDEYHCACSDAECTCNRAVLRQGACAACLNGRHQIV